MTLRIVIGVTAAMTAATLAKAEPFFLGLGDLPGGLFSSMAHGVSADGTVVVGHGTIHQLLFRRVHPRCPIYSYLDMGSKPPSGYRAEKNTTIS